MDLTKKLGFLFLFILIGSVAAAPFTPRETIDMQRAWPIVNATNISGNGTINWTGYIYLNNAGVCTADNGLCVSGGVSGSGNGWANNTTHTYTLLAVIVNSTTPTSFSVINSSATQLAVNGTSGHVGIGTATPIERLHVAGGNIRINGNQIYGIGGTAYGLYGTTSSLSLRTASTDRLYINSTGGVGINTVSPVGMLTVNGTANITDSLTVGTGNQNVTFNMNTSSTGGKLTVNGQETEFNGAGVRLRLINQNNVNYYIGQFNTADVFSIGNATATPAMSIARNNRIGVGTVTPTQRLDVNGSANFTGEGYIWSSNISIDRNGAAASASLLEFQGQRVGIKAENGDIYLYTTQSNTANSRRIVFNANVSVPNTSNADAFIDENGNMVLGRGSVARANNRLEVNGSINATADIWANGFKVCQSDGTNCPSAGSETDPRWSANESRVTNLELANQTLNASIANLQTNDTNQQVQIDGLIVSNGTAIRNGSSVTFSTLNVSGTSQFLNVVAINSTTGPTLRLYGALANHTYIEFYPQNSTSSRGGYIGYSSAGTSTLTVLNQFGGPLVLGGGNLVSASLSTAGNLGLGIGSGSATQRLQVNGSAVVQGNVSLNGSGNQTRIYLEGGVDNPTSVAYELTESTATGNHGGRLAIEGANNRLTIDTKLGGSFTNAISIPYSGTTLSYVGIGTANPTQKLSVNGSINVSSDGYFSGELNVTGTIRQNGVTVCLQDGTNCPASSGDNSSWNQTGYWNNASNSFYPLNNNPLGYYNSTTIVVPYQSSAAGWANTTTNTSTSLSVATGNLQVNGNANVTGTMSTGNFTVRNATLTVITNITGGIDIQGTTSSTNIQLTLGTGGNAIAKKGSAGSYTSWGAQGDTIIRPDSNKAIHIGSASTALVYVETSTNRIGIGPNIIPTHTLTVNGSANITSNLYLGESLNVTGLIRQNGVLVCLSDGTNCPASGSESDPVWSGNASRVTNLETANQTMNTSITNLNTAVGQLQTANQTTNTSVVNLRTAVSNLESANTTMVNNASGQQTAIVNLQNANQTMNASIIALNTGVGNLQTANQTLNTSVVNLRTAVTNLESANTTMVNNASAQQVSIANLQTANQTLNTSVGNLLTAVSALQTANTTTNSSVVNLMQRVSDLNNSANIQLLGFNTTAQLETYFIKNSSIPTCTGTEKLTSAGNGVFTCAADQDSGGTGGNPFNQTLNTTSKVTFSEINITGSNPLLRWNGTNLAWTAGLEDSNTNLKFKDPDGAVILQMNKDSDSVSLQNSISTASYGGTYAHRAKAASSQTANIFEVTDSSNNPLVMVNGSGWLNASQGICLGTDGCRTTWPVGGAGVGTGWVNSSGANNISLAIPGVNISMETLFIDNANDRVTINSTGQITPLYVVADVNNYAEINIQNMNGGNTASSDFVATNNIGSTNSFFVDLGINNDNFTSSTFTIARANDSYLYAQNSSLAIGTSSAGKKIVFFTNSTLVENQRAEITDTGMTVNGTLSAYSGAPVFTTSSYFCDFMDSISSAVATCAPSYVGAGITSGTSSAVAGNITMPGVMSMSDTTAANSGFRYQTSITGLRLNGSERFVTLMGFPALTNANTTMHRIGFHDSVNNVDAADGCYFQVINNTRIGAKTGNNSVYNSSSTNITISTTSGANGAWYKFEVNVGPNAAYCNFKVYNYTNEVYNSTPLFDVNLTNNIPVQSGREVGAGVMSIGLTAGTATVISYIDYMYTELPKLRRPIN